MGGASRTTMRPMTLSVEAEFQAWAVCIPNMWQTNRHLRYVNLSRPVEDCRITDMLKVCPTAFANVDIM